MCEMRGSTNNQPTNLFLMTACLFITTLITSNIIAIKLISINLSIYQVNLPAAIIIFPISYILGDILTEVYGFRAARSVIGLGFLLNLFAVLAIWIGQLLPPASFWDGQTSYETTLGLAPRILLASWLAYLLGEISNSLILSKLKVVTRGKWLWVRTIGSTIVGQGLDSAIFITVAFSGILTNSDLSELIVTQWLAKIIYETLATPLTYGAVSFFKRKDGLDTYDDKISFSPLGIFR